jgi:Tol biopolymer transport system component
MKTIKLSAALALALMAALLAADASSASSIVFTKGGNVWRSSPDGRHQTRLTRDGGYSSPSQDDRGRVWAVQRGRFVRLSRGGRRIGAPFSAAVGRSGNVTAYGPWEAQVSPDGRRIAYGLGVEQAALFAPEPVGDPSFGQWFSDTDVAQIGDGELSRDGSMLVVGAGGGLDLNNIAIYRLSANTPPDAPERVCTYHSKDGSTACADPTFSPRGDALAFAQDAPGKRADGVYVWSLKRGCTGTARRIARGAIDPDWGPR